MSRHPGNHAGIVDRDIDGYLLATLSTILQGRQNELAFPVPKRGAVQFDLAVARLSRHEPIVHMSNDSTAITPLPVAWPANELMSFASHAGASGSSQSGMSVVLVDAVSVNPVGRKAARLAKHFRASTVAHKDKQFRAGENRRLCHSRDLS